MYFTAVDFFFQASWTIKKLFFFRMCMRVFEFIRICRHYLALFVADAKARQASFSSCFRHLNSQPAGLLGTKSAWNVQQCFPRILSGYRYTWLLSINTISNTSPCFELHSKNAVATKSSSQRRTFLVSEMPYYNSMKVRIWRKHHIHMETLKHLCGEMNISLNNYETAEEKRRRSKWEEAEEESYEEEEKWANFCMIHCECAKSCRAFSCILKFLMLNTIEIERVSIFEDFGTRFGRFPFRIRSVCISKKYLYCGLPGCAMCYLLKYVIFVYVIAFTTTWTELIEDF